jgi:hypothetical protein
MKTSPTNAQAIERFLSGSLSTAGNLLFRARLLTDPELRVQVAQQKKVYALVQLYGRRKIKSRLEAIHQQLFSDPAKKSFQQQVLHYFINP